MVKNTPSRQSGLIMPKNFPFSAYRKIDSIMCTQNKKYPQSVSEFISAWKAVAYRFYTCYKSNEGFTKSLKKAGDYPHHPERHKQESNFFHFFVNGNSTLESFGYALYMIASTVKPGFFPIKSSNLRAIYFGATCDKFNSEKDGFPNEKITVKLNQLKNSPEFKEWKEVRHTLIHRTSPVISTSEEINIMLNTDKIPMQVINVAIKKGETSWKIKNGITINIDKNTTNSRFSWFEDSLINLMDATQDFTYKYIK